jgi:hypothetical protein
MMDQRAILVCPHTPTARCWECEAAHVKAERAARLATATEEEKKEMSWAQQLGSLIVQDVSLTYETEWDTHTVRMVDGVSHTTSVSKFGEDFLFMWEELAEAKEKPLVLSDPRTPSAREKSRQQGKQQAASRRRKLCEKQKASTRSQQSTTRSQQLQAIRKNVANATADITESA